MPCRHAGKLIAHEYGHPELASQFVKAAMGRRGILALVEREGLIKTDDRIRLVWPRNYRNEKSAINS